MDRTDDKVHFRFGKLMTHPRSLGMILAQPEPELRSSASDFSAIAFLARKGKAKYLKIEKELGRFNRSMNYVDLII